MAPTVRLLNKFKVGADPEFVVVGLNNTPFNLSSYISDMKAPFGWDHTGTVAELHPAPKRSTYNIVRGLKSILDTAPEATKNLRWKAGALWGWDAMEDPTAPGRLLCIAGQVVIGGHIHLDIPYIIGASSWVSSGDELRRIAALDAFTMLLEALDFLPRNESARRRQTTQYGKFGAYKIKHNNNHLEYRTMASWLHDPKVAMIALTGAKIIGQFPQESYTYLSQPIVARKRLRGFFEQVNVSDTDVTRVREKLNLESMRPDVEEDMKRTWAQLEF